MHFPTLRLVIVSHRGLIGVEAESGSFWLKVVGEVAEKRRRVPLEHRDIEADSCAGKADLGSMLCCRGEIVPMLDSALRPPITDNMKLGPVPRGRREPRVNIGNLKLILY
jgi:hypothetical protein